MIYNYNEKEIEIRNNNNNEIICFNNKMDKYKIQLLHDFKYDFFENNYKESYRKAKGN